MKKVSVLIIGGGGRGSVYSGLLNTFASEAEVVAVAEPRAFFRNRIARTHQLPPDRVFADWKNLLALPKCADAVILATQDRMHLEPALAFAERGYDILIEKPLAPTLEECEKIAASAQKNHILLAACHILRYTPYTQALKQALDNGTIGKIQSIQHLEPVGYWRFAHSFVRGNWAKESVSSSLLLQKSVHDLDWLCALIPAKPAFVSSFGSRSFFTPENRPAEAAGRCLDCPLQETCPYSAPRFYIERIRSGEIDSYLEAVTEIPSEEALLKRLRTGPYGRCVFACDNDVVDHQVVSVEFENGVTAAFTLAGCSRYEKRQTRIFGSLGEISGDGNTLRRYLYATGKTEEIPLPAPLSADRHGGGDAALLKAFLTAVRTRDPSILSSRVETSLETHRLVFAAEESRKNRCVVRL